MNFFLRFLIFAVGLTLGLLVLKYTHKIVYTLGKNEWAERKLGSGGSYTIWQLTGLAIIVLSFLVALFV